MDLFNELGMLAEQTAVAQSPEDINQWLQSLSGLINELNGGFDPLPVPPSDLPPEMPDSLDPLGLKE